jgi:tetratricopeptide (TPR) repeat protein
MPLAMREHPLHELLVLGLVVLGTACRQDRHAPADVALDSGGAADRGLVVDLGCERLPEDHNALYKRGIGLIDPYLKVIGRAAAADPERGTRLSAGISCLDRVLSLNPSNWAALWFRGKAYQANGDHTQAARSFESAYAIESKNPDVGRELVVEYLHVGRFSDAVRIADAVSSMHPEDAGLRANLALALLMDRQAVRAREVIAEARRQDPGDPISQALEGRIVQVVDGSRPQPRTIDELER